MAAGFPGLAAEQRAQRLAQQSHDQCISFGISPSDPRYADRRLAVTQMLMQEDAQRRALAAGAIMAGAQESSKARAFVCFPLSSPADSSAAVRLAQPGKSTDFKGESGAGEGIRTLDPNLGKVVLYP